MDSMVYDVVKIGVAVPTAGLIRAACVFSLMQLVGQLAQVKLWPEAKAQGMQLLMREGSGIAPNRQKMVDEAIEAQCTHILFVDDDMEWEPAAVLSLASRRMPIVGCNYRMKFPPADFTAVHLDKTRGRMETTEASRGLEPVDYMGFGLCLIETRVFGLLTKPYFLGGYIDGVYTTEDLPFYWAAREKGIIAYCDQDASKHVAHIGIHKYLWYQKFDKPADPKNGAQAG